MNCKKYSIIFISVLCILIGTCIGMVWCVDPYFHFHAPNKNFSYSFGFDDQRYINDGITRNFEYNAIITGTSMVENFKATEFNKLFNVSSVKVPFSSGSYKEINDNLKKAVESQNIKYVIRALDYSKFFTSKDEMRDDFDYPLYLTNDNILDDVYYVLNKDIIFEKVLPTLKSYSKSNGCLTSFDDYSNWMAGYIFGKESVLSVYTRAKNYQKNQVPSKDSILSFQENIDINIVSLVKENPNIDFYFFLTPYSIVYWDSLKHNGTMEQQFIGEKMIIESLLPYENAKLFSFSDNFDLVTNLDNYKDIAHYSEEINSYMLQEMKNNKHLITSDNYQNYLSIIREFYSNYDYDSIFE